MTRVAYSVGVVIVRLLKKIVACFPSGKMKTFSFVWPVKVFFAVGKQQEFYWRNIF